MNCDQIDDALPRYLDGEASEFERRSVERHLASCSSCRVTLRNLRRVDSIVAAWPELPDEMRPYLTIVDERVRRRIRRARLLRPTLLVLRRTLSLAVSAAIVVIVAGLGLALLLMGSQFEEARQTVTSAPSKFAAPLFAELSSPFAAPTRTADQDGLYTKQLANVVKITVMDYRQSSSRTNTDEKAIQPALHALESAQFIRRDPELDSKTSSQSYIVQLGLRDGSNFSLIYLPSAQGPNVEDPGSHNWWRAPDLDAAMQPLLPNPPTSRTPLAVSGPTNRPTTVSQPSAAPTTTPELQPTQTPRSEPVRHLPAPAVSLAVAPGSAQTVYALLVTNALYRSDDGGQTWHQLPLPATKSAYDTSGSSDQLAGAFLIPPHNLWVSGGNRARIFVVADRVLYGSDDGGVTWKPLNDSVYAWTVADPTGHVVYAWHGTAPSESSGLYRTSDGGATWQEVYRGAFPPFLATAPCPCSHEGISALANDPHNLDTVYAGTDYGVYRSVDGGKTWNEISAGMPASVSRYRWTPILAVASDGTVYAVTDVLSNASSSLGEVIRLRPGGSAWTTASDSTLAGSRNPNATLSGFQWVAPDPANPSRAYLGTSRGLLVSDDAGASWRSMPEWTGHVVYEIVATSGNAGSDLTGSADRLYLLTDAGFAALPPATR
jgi:photosystem II stability/assembly factor-like uncharacterized protein